MTQSSWPFEGVDTTETQYSRLLRHIGQGVNGVPGDNNLLVYANASGMNVKVKVSGGVSQAIVRGHMYQSTAEETLTIGAASVSPRIDAVVLRLDPSVNSIALAVVAGTPGTSPSAPTLTQTDTSVYELLLAYVNVPASATSISAGDVTDKRSFIEKVWTTSNRPAAQLGLTGYNATTSKLETWNGTSWVEVTPTSLDASVITSGTFGTARIADGAITDAKIASLQASKLTSVSFNSSVITSGTFGTARIADSAITDAKIASLQANKLTGLTANQIVTTNSAGQAVSASQIQTSQVAGYGTGIWTGTVTAGGNAVTGGNASFSGSVSSVGGFTGGTVNVGGNAVICGNFVNSGTITSPASRNTISGSWNVLYIDANGVLGIPPSAERFKQDIEPSELSGESILDVDLVTFRYKQDVKELGNDSPVQLGLIAEQVEAALGSDFVFYDEDGNIGGVHYERLALALIPAVQEQAARLASIESRLEALEA